MLDVDRSTVYRMAEDGRLPAIKVGRQWRFPTEQIAEVLRVGAHVDSQGFAFGVLASRQPPLGTEAPFTGVAAAVSQVAADLLGVMMVVTDMQGHPLTEVVNPCPWFAARSGDPELIDACVAEWRLLADDPDFEPRLAVGVLGFECARAFVRHGTSLVGMVLAGGIAPAGGPAAGLYELDDAGRGRVLAALPRVAATLSRASARP